MVEHQGSSGARFPLINSAISPVTAADHGYGFSGFCANDFLVTVHGELVIEL
jgi:hypothetical protein